jgi:hypothetical protein
MIGGKKLATWIGPAGAEWADNVGWIARDRYRFDRLADKSRSSI